MGNNIVYLGIVYMHCVTERILVPTLLMCKDRCSNFTHNTYTGRAEYSPGVVVVVEEAGGAVETER